MMSTYNWVATNLNNVIIIECYFQAGDHEKETERIRKAAHYCQPVGDDYFCREIEKKYGLKPGYSRRGRPPKQPA